MDQSISSTSGLSKAVTTFSKPSVTLIAQTVVNGRAIDQWMEERGFKFYSDASNHADVLSEIAGRVCYLSFNADKRKHKGAGQNRRYIQENAVQKKHGSITEHPSFSFAIDHVSRNCTHELVRHRVGTAFSQTSTRYVDQLEFADLGFYIPPEIALIRDLYAEWLEQYAKLADLYSRSFDRLRAMGMEKKRARSIARHILSGSAGTCLIFTVNARELNHIFDMRGSEFADDEIRRMTLCMYEAVKHMSLFAHWKRENHELVKVEVQA